MKVVIQTVDKASVLINNKTKNEIGNGYLVYVGFTNTDTQENVDKMIYKLAGLRVFPDENSRMNLSIRDVNGEILVISNFTLYGNLAHGFRPSFENSLEPMRAKLLYDNFIAKLNKVFPNKIQTGKFGANMEVTSVNHGPKTFVYEV